MKRLREQAGASDAQLAYAARLVAAHERRAP